jgi:type II secretory pathway component PulF
MPLTLAPNDTADLAAHVASLAKAGLPLDGGLRALAAELPRGSLQRSVRRLAELLSAGTPLETALAERTVRLPAHLQGLIVAGVRSGQLPEALQEHVDMLQAAQQANRRTVVNLIYPAIVAALMAGILQIPRMFSEIVSPDLLTGFNFWGWSPPIGPSAVALAAVNLAAPVGWLAIGLLVPVAAVIVLGSLVPHSAAVTTLFGQLPLIGPPVFSRKVAEFCRLAALLVEQRVPLPEALQLTAAGIGDAGLARGTLQLAAAATAGSRLAPALAANRHFPATLAPLVAWGETNAALADALRAAAEMYGEQAVAERELWEAVLPPAIFVAVAVVAVFFIIFIGTPIVQLFGY